MYSKTILIITSRFPFPLEKGDKLRIYHQIKYLSRYNSIHLVSLNTESKIPEISIKELNKYCEKIHIINMFIKLGPIIVTFAKLFVNIFEIIPLIFDPPTFINDILFGITWGINNLFSKVIASMNTEKEKDPNSESGTFGVSEENQKLYTCADPTLGMILLLVVCPPLAIFYKLGIEGMVSAIICGVLCVKLYYFPGLLFAILHVLC